MTIEYFKADQDVHDRMYELIAANHPDLALVDEKMVIVFRAKAAKSGGEKVMGAVRKATPLMNALSRLDHTFILELAEDVWRTLTWRQQEALLDHLLCQCRAKEDPKSGKVTLTIARPDLTAFRENIGRYGLWFPVGENDHGGFRFQVVRDDDGSAMTPAEA